MTRIECRNFLAGLAFGLTVATSAAAQDYVANIVSQLEDQGFSKIVQERTLLGRVRIFASSNDGLREIILNPNTGEILRDLWMPAAGSTRKIAIVDGGSGSGGSGGSGSGSGGDDDDDDDDDEDDEDDGEDDDDEDDGEDDGEDGGEDDD